MLGNTRAVRDALEALRCSGAQSLTPDHSRRAPDTEPPPRAPSPRPAGTHTPRCRSLRSRVCGGRWVPRAPAASPAAPAAPAPEESRVEEAWAGEPSPPHSRAAYSPSRSL